MTHRSVTNLCFSGFHTFNQQKTTPDSYVQGLFFYQPGRLLPDYLSALFYRSDHTDPPPSLMLA